MKRLLIALAFAAEKHRDHRRKDGTETPYINHPIEVAALLADLGGIGDEAILMAALLHDTVEDTDTTFSEIREHFGSQVELLVAEVTDDRAQTRLERWAKQVEHASHLSHGAKLIKLADKIHNVRSIIFSPPALWSDQRKLDYISWTKQVVDLIRGTNVALETRYDQVYSEAMELVSADR
ncbi:phosphohydrolase [bacterium M21]|nr:phosphohydrolase [bacterium M21]